MRDESITVLPRFSQETPDQDVAGHFLDVGISAARKTSKKRQKGEEDKKLVSMIDEYKKKRNTEREGKNKDYHIMDNYIQVLTFLHRTSRFQQFFDPLRLRMMLIKPKRMENPDFWKNSQANVENFPNIFLTGCHLYQL